MKYCSKCGTPAEDNQNFCLNCGSKLSAPIAQQAAAAAETAQGQLAAQQHQTAAAAQTMQEQLAAQQTAAAEVAATVQAQQQAAAAAAAQVAATAEAQQAAAEAAAKAKSEAEAAAKAAAQVEALRQAAATPSGAEAAIAQSQATAQAAVAQAQAATQQAAQAAVPMAQQAAQVAPQASAADGEKKKGGAGKWFAIIGFALVAVVLLIILLVNVLGSSYQTPVKKLVSTMNSKSLDSDDYLAIYPKMVKTLYNDSLKLAKEGVNLMGNETISKVLDSYDYGASMSSMYDSYEKRVGKNLKFSYSIQDKTELDAAKLASIANSYKSLATKIKTYEDAVTQENSSTKSTLVAAGVKAKDANDYCDKVSSAIMKLRKEFEGITEITAGYDLKVRLTYKGDKDEDRRDQTIRVLKINGKWVFDITDSDSMLDSSFITELINMMMLKFN